MEIGPGAGWRGRGERVARAARLEQGAPAREILRGSRGRRHEEYDKRGCEPHAGLAVWIRTMWLAPDSPPQTSPRRPSSWRILALARPLAKLVKVSLTGS